MKTTNDFSLSPRGPRALVRNGYSQCDVWRSAIPGSVPLLACAIDGPLDAPENMPAGGLRSYRGGAIGEVFYRF